jgi:hypothetical protein
MAADFSFDEFSFNDGVFDDFLKDLDADQRTQNPVDLTFQSFEPPTPDMTIVTSNAMLTACNPKEMVVPTASYISPALVSEKDKETYDTSDLVVEASSVAHNTMGYAPTVGVGYSSAPPQMFLPAYSNPVYNSYSFHGGHVSMVSPYPPFMATGHISPPLPPNLDNELLQEILMDDERERQMLAALDVDADFNLSTPRTVSSVPLQAISSPSSAHSVVSYPPHPSNSRHTSDVSQGTISSIYSINTNQLPHQSHKRKSVPRSPGLYRTVSGDFGGYDGSSQQQNMPSYTATDGQVLFNPFQVDGHATDVFGEDTSHLSNPISMSYNGFTQAAPKIQRVSHPLLNFPHSLFEAFNGGDLKRVNTLIQQHAVSDCLLLTPALMHSLHPPAGSYGHAPNEVYVQGQSYITDFFAAVAEVHPDSVWIAKKVRYHPPVSNANLQWPTINHQHLQKQQLQQKQQHQQQPQHQQQQRSQSVDKASSAMNPHPLSLQVPTSQNTKQDTLIAKVTCRVYFAGTRVAPNLATADLLPVQDDASRATYLFQAPGSYLTDCLEHRAVMTAPELHALRELEQQCPSLSVFGKGTMTLWIREEDEKIVLWDMQWTLSSFRASDM